MAVDLNSMQTNRQGLDSGVQAPVTEGVVSSQVRQEVEKVLGAKVTDSEMMAYMASQSTSLLELQSRPPVKAAAGELPPPPPETDADLQPPEFYVSEEEVQVLRDYANELMTLSSEGGDAGGEWANGVNNVLKDLEAQFGPTSGGGKGEWDGSIFDWMMVGELSRESQEKEQEWKDLFARLASGKNVDETTILLAMGEYVTDKYGTAMADTIKQFASKQQAHQEYVASLELDKGIAPSASEMMLRQNEMSTAMQDQQVGFQTLQALNNDIKSVQNLVKSQLSSIHMTRQGMIRNIAVTAG